MLYATLNSWTKIKVCEFEEPTFEEIFSRKHCSEDLRFCCQEDAVTGDLHPFTNQSGVGEGRIFHLSLEVSEKGFAGLEKLLIWNCIQIRL